MKKGTKLLRIYIVIALLVITVSLVFKLSLPKDTNYNEKLIKYALDSLKGKQIYDDFFEVTKNPSSYDITLNDKKITINVINKKNSNTSSSYESPVEISSNSVLKLISKSKKTVCNYIANSPNIFNNQEDAIKYIESLPFLQCKINIENTLAFYEKGTIFIKENSEKQLCEWILVHELIHALSDFCQGMKMEQNLYSHTLFNEVITELITWSLDPKLTENSKYLDYQYFVLPYIAVFKNVSIHAYFYGDYSRILKYVDNNLFSFYTFLIDYIGKEPWAVPFCESSLNQILLGAVEKGILKTIP